jgi:hypothetical protein
VTDREAALQAIIEGQKSALLHWRKAYDLAYQEGAAAEREACLKIAEDAVRAFDEAYNERGAYWAAETASKIRARGQEGV